MSVLTIEIANEGVWNAVTCETCTKRNSHLYFSSSNNTRVMQIRIITLETTSSLLRDMTSYFPGADVKIQPAIDVRNTPTLLLQSSGMITHTAVNSVKYGRRWHHEMGSKGAVGLAHANRLALTEDVTQPLLLLEDDCIIMDRIWGSIQRR